MHQNRTPTPLGLSLRCGKRPLVLSVLAVLTLGGCAQMPADRASQNIRGGYAAGDKVTVLLPSKGPIADVADAVRAGVRAAHGADDTAAKPALEFTDVGQPAKVPEVLTAAVKAGTTHAIGPIQKPAVDALAGGSAVTIPTLALNQSTRDGKPPANLFQFALSPETEAVEAANRARAMGFQRALMLYPAGDAGKRRADAFRSKWQQLGGTLAAESGFDPAAKDYAKTVTKLLGSQADFLFLSADAAQARKIYPLVRRGAATLPVIATSEVYPGDADRARDKDLTGLYFVDLPWVLGIGAAQDPLARAKLRAGAPYLSTPLGLRLYAMGIDAYRLAPRLTTLAKTPGAVFPGETGTLSLDSLGRVQRQLALGQFTENGPQPVLAQTQGQGASWMSRLTSAPAPKAEPRKAAP